MRILHVITAADLGGAQSVAAELSRWAVDRGYEVAIASQAAGPLWGILDPRVGQFPLPSFAKSISPWRDLRSFFELKRALRSYKPDIVHLHSSKAGVLGRLAAGRLRSHTVYTVHGFDSIRTAYPIFLPLERVLQRFCGAVVAVSAYDLANLAAQGINRRVRVIRNGVRDWAGVVPSDLAAAAAMEKARGAMGAVLCIARLAPPKRFDLFLEAAFLLPQAEFFWIGNESGPGLTGLPANLHMLGSLAEAGAYANLVDLLVLFSDFEGMPMSILESLSCGTPVVASRVGGIAEVLDDACGLAVPNEIQAIVSAISRFLPAQGKSGASGASPRLAARKRYLEGFSLSTMAEAYDELYRELITG